MISGTFRNIAGTISSIDAAAGTIVVKDVLSRKSVTVKLTTESQMRKLPPNCAADRILPESHLKQRRPGRAR